MKVVLMGLEFFINNLGCEALSYSFVSELYEITKDKGEELEVSTIVFADQKVPYIPGTDIPIRCIGIHYKSLKFWKEIKKEFKEADFIFDFTMGDSFADIYGKKRFILDALVKTSAIRSKTPYILGPQTYGPYKSAFVRNWAKWIIKKAARVYTRDEQSKQVAEQLSSRDILLTTDVAFALPYERKEIGTEGKIKIGFNPSGLLWAGGYTQDNQFGLTLNYQEYCWKVCEELSRDSRYEVFLIPHVGTMSGSESEELQHKDDSLESEDGLENDSAVCKLIKKRYSAMKILDGISTPMDVKGYIAAMDVFIGARMHATIGAFSSGVVTIPVSYSRKFEGLYDSLGYDYLIHARDASTDEAVKKTLEYVWQYDKLKPAVEKSLKIVGEKQRVFREYLLKDLQ